MEHFLEELKHDTTSSTVKIDDAFTRWRKSMTGALWRRVDLTGCAFAWNAAIDAVIIKLQQQEISSIQPQIVWPFTLDPAYICPSCGRLSDLRPVFEELKRAAAPQPKE